MKRLVILVLVCLVLGNTASVHSQGAADLYIDAGQSRGPVSPYVYGANYGPLSQVPLDLMDVAKASGVTMLRFPGGRWGDQYDLQHFQVDMFITFCRMIGAEPSISVRLEKGTPDDAAALVQYTLDKGYNVRYWSIGNEPNLFDDYTIDQLNQDWRAIADAMLAVDPDIILIGPDTSQFTGNSAVDPHDAGGRDWLREFLLANGDLVDIVAVHRYPFPSSRAELDTTPDDLRQNAPEWTQIVQSLRAVVKETTRRDDLPVAITEANSQWSSSVGGEATPDSFYHAIWWADVLGRLIAEQTAIVDYFELQTPSSRGAFGLMGNYDPYPTYYTYQLYQHFGTELVASSSTTPDVTIYAALREDGALTFVVVNLGPDEQTKTLEIDHFEIKGPAQAWRLDAGNNAGPIDDVDLGGGTITVPGQSATVLILGAN